MYLSALVLSVALEGTHLCAQLTLLLYAFV